LSGFRKGDRVLLMESIGTGMISTIKKGTEGIVLEEPGYFSSSYRVKFDDGREEFVPDRILGAGSDPRR
jgi:hypothetical protein